MNITVYCASSSKLRPVFYDTAAQLGQLMARRGHTLLNGAGTMGLMGASADACLQAGGQAIGVMPQFMVDEGWAHQGMTRLIVTQTMHERKARLASLADACIVLPGGLGTLDELFDILTLKQLGIYLKPVVLLNTEHFFDPLLAHLSHAIDENMLRTEHAQAWQVAGTPAEAVGLCETTPPFRADIRKIAHI
ncbi:MAG: TIGR00730 family Rossman fold protein [Bacteroidaceae bacterium]|nr:TIGR00730 family Rossman fold protein [Bacteroidaceae bacterium]